MHFLFIGDSITEGFDLDKYFPGMGFSNRGISGYSSEEVLKALQPEWFFPKPDRVFVCIGTNDLAREYIENQTLGNIAGITAAIWEMAGEDTPVILTSLFPTRHNPPRPNTLIKQLNNSIHHLCTEIQAIYFHLNPFFTDHNGQLRREFTEDGLHLTPAAYEKWALLIRISAGLPLQGLK